MLVTMYRPLGNLVITEYTEGQLGHDISGSRPAHQHVRKVMSDAVQHPHPFTTVVVPLQSVAVDVLRRFPAPQISASEIKRQTEAGPSVIIAMTIESEPAEAASTAESWIGTSA